jgi:hypothetical protein
LALADGEPQQAIDDSAQAVASWSKEHWHLQHLFAQMAAARAELYQGMGGAAWQRLTTCWPRFTASMQHLLQNKRMFMLDLRGRAGAMAILSGELPSSELYRVERDAKQLENEKTPWAAAYALALRAAIALIRQQTASAIQLYQQVVLAFDDRQMPLHGAATRMRLGLLTADDALVQKGTEALQKLGVKEPYAFANALVAGPVLRAPATQAAS